MDLEEIEAAARRQLRPEVYDYYAGGAMDEETLAANVADWRALRLRPRVLRDVRDVSTGVTLLGTPVANPVGVAPTAYHRLAHDDGEAATAAAAAKAGALFVLSTRSMTPVEDVASRLEGAPWWFQVYVVEDRDVTAQLVRRAAAAGCAALVLTGDTPMLGRRLRDVRNRFVLPTELGTIESLERPDALGAQDRGVTFADIAWLAEMSGLPVVVKGVLRGDDAQSCLRAGAAAVWVSNHGGRQLDGAVSTAAALPEVVAAVGSRAEVFVDGGVRRGTDVLRALALGARAVFVGRPVLWALAALGGEGVHQVLTGLQDELALAMALAGCRDVSEVTPDLVAAPPGG